VAASDSGSGSFSGLSTSSTASVSMGMFEHAMKTIHEGYGTTHTLLSRMMDRIEDIQEQLNVTGLHSNVPVDPNYVNNRLMENQAKLDKLLPMLNDEMLYAFERCLVESAAEACDRDKPDKVCFISPLKFVSRSCELVRVQLYEMLFMFSFCSTLLTRFPWDYAPKMSRRASTNSCSGRNWRAGFLTQVCLEKLATTIIFMFSIF
jgi:hypothetical protein